MFYAVVASAAKRRPEYVGYIIPRSNVGPVLKGKAQQQSCLLAVNFCCPTGSNLARPRFDRGIARLVHSVTEDILIRRRDNASYAIQTNTQLST